MNSDLDEDPTGNLSPLLSGNHILGLPDMFESLIDDSIDLDVNLDGGSLEAYKEFELKKFEKVRQTEIIAERILDTKILLEQMKYMFPKGDKTKPTKQQTVVEKKDGLLFYQLPDNSFVQLICPHCSRFQFVNSAGFENHCRILHNIQYTSPENAALECGTPVEESEVPEDDPSRIVNNEKKTELKNSKNSKKRESPYNNNNNKNGKKPKKKQKITHNNLNVEDVTGVTPVGVEQSIFSEPASNVILKPSIDIEQSDKSLEDEDINSYLLKEIPLKIPILKELDEPKKEIIFSRPTSLEDWNTWTPEKQLSVEWQRARLARKLLLEKFQCDFATHILVDWFRKNNLTPESEYRTDISWQKIWSKFQKL